MKGEPQHATVRTIPGEECTFEVRSSSHPSEWHRVDIAAHKGAGECACVRWRTVCWPRIKQTGSLPPSLRCRHLKAARELCLNNLIALFNREHPSE